MSWMDKRDEMHGQLRKLNKAIPEVTKAFAGVSAVVKTDGALDVKTKELIAVAIAVADSCEPCMNFHIEVLIRAGGSREELGEALGANARQRVLDKWSWYHTAVRTVEQYELLLDEYHNTPRSRLPKVYD